MKLVLLWPYVLAAVTCISLAIGCQREPVEIEVAKSAAKKVAGETGGWTHPQDLETIALIQSMDSSDPQELLYRSNVVASKYPRDARPAMVRVAALVRLGRLIEAKSEMDKLFATPAPRGFFLPDSPITLYAELAEATGTPIGEPVRQRTIARHKTRPGFPSEPTESQIIARIYLDASVRTGVGEDRFYYVRRALATSPDSSLVWLSFAGGCRARGYFIEAADAYRQYAAFGENDPFVSNNLSAAAALRAARYCDNLARTRPKRLEQLGGYRFILPSQSDMMIMRPLRGLDEVVSELWFADYLRTTISRRGRTAGSDAFRLKNL